MYNIKKNIDRLKEGKETYFLDPYEVNLVTKSFKKNEYNICRFLGGYSTRGRKKRTY